MSIAVAKEASLSADGDIQTLPLPAVVKGNADWRSFRAIELPNGIVCVLVNDKESKTTAAAVCVNVGASCDPRDLSGLAHFTEHMCFLGSEKYPGESEYKRYLSCHGGRSNASTSMHFTTYKFDVLAKHAEPAIDIFSNFFIAPLFTQSGTSREVSAVDSENSKNLTNDSRRRLQVLKALADSNHHYSKFSTGNATTLPAAENSEESTKHVREALLAFHKHHYRPDNMTVVVAGPQSLDTLQDWTVPRFASMTNRWNNVQEYSKTSINKSISTPLSAIEIKIQEAAKDCPPNPRDITGPPAFQPAFRHELQGGKWPVVVTTLPLRDVRKLVLNFVLPSVMHIPDQSPVKILSHLLGHEGTGSSFAVLQDAGLLSALSTGSRISAPDQCLLQIDVALTERGEQKWQTVVGVLFEHCRLLYQVASLAAEAKTESSSKVKDSAKDALESLERIWGEIASLSAMHFHQASPGTAYDLAPSLAQSLVMNGTEKCLSAGMLLNERRESLPLDALVDFSSRLMPSNCIVERCSRLAWEEEEATNSKEERDASKFFGLQKEKWYGVEYYVSKVPDDVIAAWESGTFSKDDTIGPLALPHPNRYIPRTLELCPDVPDEAREGPRIEKEIDPPKLIADVGGIGRLWHRMDDRYALPKSCLIILMRNAAVENARDETGAWSHSTEAAVQSQLLASMFSEAMAQETYDASLAGLQWSLSSSSSGIRLSCAGFSDRLPYLAVELMKKFLLVDNGDSCFLKQSYFGASKDRMVRSLKSYLQSGRADSHASYYRNLMLSSQGGGIGTSLKAAESMSLESVGAHYHRILENTKVEIDTLFTGNVSVGEAKDFFSTASAIIKDSRAQCDKSFLGNTENSNDEWWVPGLLERRLELGKDIEIHFKSQNSEEENGAVLMTFQSPLPGFKGGSLSSLESLRSSASLRLLCHMLREPLFDDLRTKQQLGYIVSSYHDLDFSMRQLDAKEAFPNTTPVDSIVINVLSRKVSPPEGTKRIDAFLKKFRKILVKMPVSEIESHSDALSAKMLKPIQKLSNEASLHFRKIQPYGPEILAAGGVDSDLPWQSSHTLAATIRDLKRDDLLEVWDRVVSSKNRARLVSCVYGKTFPLSEATILKGSSKLHVIVDSTGDLLAKRKKLVPYDDFLKSYERSPNALLRSLSRNRTVLGVAAVAVIGAGVIGVTMSRRSKK